MSQLALKVLLGVGSTGLACAVPVSLFYGLRGNSGASSLNSSVNSVQTNTQLDTSDTQETYSPSRPKITCQRNGEEERMQYLDGVEVGPEVKKQLEQAMRSEDGQCVDYNETTS